MNFLGVDWGEKRIGLSFGDDDVGVAYPLAAANQASKRERYQFIQDVLKERRVHELVIGYPYNMDGTIGFKAKEVDVFIEEMEERFRLPVHRIDERLTSHHADQGARLMRKGPRSKKQTIQDRKSGAKDSASAAIILQDFLDNRLGSF